ncbi:MAG: hypothetical protein WDZ75_01705 [Candidatus Paceibacterota bacterium]
MSTCIPPQIIESLKERARRGQISAEDIAKMLPTEKAALKTILEDFVVEKLGVKVSDAEMKGITERSKAIDRAYKDVGEGLGSPAKAQETIDFFKAKRAMDDYLQSLDPASQAKVITGTIGRGMMLASIKSPVLNIGSNIEVGFTEALSRRLAEGQLRGANNQLAIDYVKLVNRVYQDTGYDISRMRMITDDGSLGERVLGETTHTQGPGKVRKVGRIVEDIVFKQLMGAPDTAFASAHFADSVNLNAMKLANGDSELGTKYMNDAMLIEPQTPEGLILREQAIMDATKATWTDSSWASRVSEGVRKILNDVSGDARVGDLVFPFVKTPSNVIATGMDYAGMGVPKALVDTYKAWKTGDLGDKAYRQKVSRELVRSGIGIVAAMAIVGTLDDDDFVGAYDPSRAQIESLRNSNYNAIRVGNRWISTDWLGPLSVSVTAMMYARKYGSTPQEMAFQYGKGVISSFKQLPGVEGVLEYGRSEAYAKAETLAEMVSGAIDTLLKNAYARLVPSFISDVAKATDKSERVAKGVVNIIKSKIPGLRQTLPEKKNIFGETIVGEPGASTILFGSRVKTDRETELIKEINSVTQEADKQINFSDWDKSSSKQLAQFKEQVGADEYAEAKVKYGKELKRLLEIEITTAAYASRTAEEKVEVLRAIDTKATDTIFKQYGFKYKKAK